MPHAGGLRLLPSQCLIKLDSSPDKGIKVWVICIDFMCCYAAPVMLISVVHKFLFKMSLQLHFLCHSSIVRPERLVVNPNDCGAVRCTLDHWRFPKFSWISTMGRKWFWGVVIKVFHKNTYIYIKRKKSSKIFLSHSEEFFLLVQKSPLVVPRVLRNNRRPH